MTTDSSHTTKRRYRAIGTAALLVVAACSSTGQPVSTTAAPTEAAVSEVTTSADPSSSTTTLAVSLPDGSALLATALDRLAVGYEYDATVLVNGEAASSLVGRWVDGAAETTIRSGGAEVDYLATADGQWARLPDGEWEALDDKTAPTVNPLEALANPMSINEVSAQDDAIVVQARYSAESLGLQGDELTVILRFVDGHLVQARYVIEGDGQTGETITSFTTLTNTTPITSPTS